MEPDAPRSRPIGMRGLALSAAALVLPLALVGCGSDDGEVASDPAPTTTATSPSASPTVGTYPEFAPADYTFQLTVSCFCAFANVPVKVTVAGGEVVSAVYTQDDGGRSGVHAGDPADKSSWLTINDVIARANDTTADKVTVDWPAGQDYPSSVYVDPHKTMADEEVGYTIADVQVS
ncbi:MAG TPA: DUF6174 domain-containing protein [Nocardioides sp.]|uniref:DUF6174 domain-containing protein n=1 Tax=Nocardioides sp. TaxID=35761 RepID=UPI002E363C97|nr:DUF6174 domain-containing protein [Nocardioides sp.]HEX5090332.1 DUF6174 domain-containing protein [Nocardioides sp.]